MMAFGRRRDTLWSTKSAASTVLPLSPPNSKKPFSSRTVLTKAGHKSLLKARGAISARSAGMNIDSYRSARGSARSSASARNPSQSARLASGRKEIDTDIDIKANLNETQHSTRSRRTSSHGDSILRSSRSEGAMVKYFGPPKMYTTTMQNYGKCFKDVNTLKNAVATRSAGQSWSGIPMIMDELFGLK